MGACSSADQQQPRNGKRSKKRGASAAAAASSSSEKNPLKTSTRSDDKKNAAASTKKQKKQVVDTAAPVVDFTAIWNQPPPPSILKGGSNSAASSSYRDREHTSSDPLVVNPLSPHAGTTEQLSAPRPRKVTMTPDADQRQVPSPDEHSSLSAQRSLDRFGGGAGGSSAAGLEQSRSMEPPSARRDTIQGPPPQLTVQQPSESPQSTPANEPVSPKSSADDADQPALRTMNSVAHDDDAGAAQVVGRTVSTADSYVSDHTQVARIQASVPPSQPSAVTPIIAAEKPYSKTTSSAPSTTKPVAADGPPPLMRPIVDVRSPAAKPPVRATPPAGPLVTIRGRLYNLEPLLKTHPGGAGVLRKYHGKDGTEEFLASHSMPPFAALAKYAMPVEL